MSCLLCGGVFNLPVTAQEKRGSSSTDVIVFKNGDQLTGTLLREIGNTVVFKSDMVGEVTVPTSKVKELRSRGSFAVFKKHEKIALTTKEPSDITLSNDTITVVDPSGAPEPVPVKDLDFVVDKPTYDKEMTGKPGIWYGWQGSIAGGANIVESTTTGQSYRVGINLFRAIPTVPDLPARSRTIFNLAETYGKLTTPVIPQTTPPSANQVAKVNIFNTNFEHSRDFTPRMYGLVGIGYGHNYSEGLNFWQAYGAGPGWTVIRDSAQQLDLSVDLHYERQNFQGSTPKRNLIGSNFNETYRRTLPYNILLTLRGTYNESWNDFHAYSAAGAVGLTMPVNERFSLNLDIRDDYLNNPAFGYKKNSFQFITGVGYRLR
ncbi:MAG: DUF481 domain-containing protein [Alloacidobacterium sp.]